MPKDKTTDPNPHPKIALSKPTQKLLCPTESDDVTTRTNPTANIVPEAREGLIKDLEEAVAKWAQLGLKDLADSNTIILEQLKAAREVSPPQMADSNETKKLKLLATDQHRVQTTHEARMREIEAEE